MKEMKRRALFVSAMLVISFSWSAFSADADKDFLWKVTSDTGGEVYLLGSIHVGKKEWFPLAKEIEAAFEKSKYLVVELDPAKADQEKMQQLLIDKGAYPFGDSISKHVSEKTDEKIKAYLESNSQPAVGVMQSKPWVVGMTLVGMEARKLGYDETSGIDTHFLDQAHAAEKEVLELEGVEFQIELLSGFNDELQEKVLLWSLEQIDDMKTDLPKAFEAWKKGDTKVVEDLDAKYIAKHPEYKPIMTKMLDDRNAKMVEKIEDYLKTKDAHFVVVGAGHLVGEKGIVKLLECKKYKIEQVGKSAAGVPAGK